MNQTKKKTKWMPFIRFSNEHQKFLQFDKLKKKKKTIVLKNFYPKVQVIFARHSTGFGFLDKTEI